jgi:hypothetical protein
MDQITPGDLCSAEVEVEDVPGDDPADDTEDGTYGLTRKRSYSSSSSVSDATDESEDEEQIGYRIPGEWPAVSELKLCGGWAGLTVLPRLDGVLGSCIFSQVLLAASCLPRARIAATTPHHQPTATAHIIHRACDHDTRVELPSTEA